MLFNMIRSYRGLLSVAMNMSKLRCVSSGFTNEVLNSYDFFRDSTSIQIE